MDGVADRLGFDEIRDGARPLLGEFTATPQAHGGGFVCFQPERDAGWAARLTALVESGFPLRREQRSTMLLIPSQEEP